MVKVKITRGTVINGIGAVPAGTTHEVDKKTLLALIAAGKGVPCGDETEPMTVREKTDEEEAEEEAAERYECPVEGCGKIYKSHSAFVKHMADKHGIAV